jgi:hypothetical protein
MPTPAPEPYVFISYAHEDRAFVDRLAARLKAAGLPLWYDEGLRGGQPWPRELARRIEAARAVVVMVTPAARASDWVEKEITYAAERGVPLVPFLLSGSLPLSLANLQYVQREANLLAALGAPPEPLPEPDGPLPEPGPLPAGSRMPFPRNVCFTGRAGDLRALVRVLLHGDGRAVISQAATVSGWGGVGKTQLAVEFAYRYGRFFPGGVFWLNAAGQETLVADVVRCGLAMGLRPWPDHPHIRLVRGNLDALEE